MSRHNHNPNGAINLLPQQQVVQPQFNVGPLMLGDQLVALVAAHCPGPAKEAVDRAMEIVSLSLARVKYGELVARVNQITAAFDAEIAKEKEKPPLEV